MEKDKLGYLIGCVLYQMLFCMDLKIFANGFDFIFKLNQVETIVFVFILLKCAINFTNYIYYSLSLCLYYNDHILKNFRGINTTNIIISVWGVCMTCFNMNINSYFSTLLLVETMVSIAIIITLILKIYFPHYFSSKDKPKYVIPYDSYV